MKKSKVLLALTFLVGMPVLMYGLSHVVEKRYTAQVRLLVDSSGPHSEYPSPFSPIDDMTMNAKPPNTATQVQILTGTEVLGEALQKARENLPNRLSNNESLSNAYEGLVRRLQVDSDPVSDVIGLRVTQTDPELSAELANDIAYAYKDYTDRRAKESSSNILTALSSQASTMKGKLDVIDGKIATLKTQAQVADATASTQSVTAAASQNQTQLDLTLSQYKGAVAELSVAKRLLNGVPKTIVASTTTQPNPVPLGLETDLTRLRTQLADLQSNFTDQNPQVKAMKQQIRQGEANLRKYKQSIPAGNSVQINPAYQTQLSNVMQLQGRVDNLRDAVASLQASSTGVQAKVNELPALQRQIDGLNRERVSLESSYLQIAQRRDVTEAARKSQQSFVTIVSTALVPEAPSFPDARLFLLAGLAVGGFLTILILMPRQETSLMSGDYYPAVYTPPTPAPEAVATPREPVTTVAPGDSAGLEAGTRHDP